MKSQQAVVPLSVEVNENIYNLMQDFLTSNPQWSRQRLINASISLFLMQNHKSIKARNYQDCSQTYLHSIGILPKPHSQN